MYQLLFGLIKQQFILVALLKFITEYDNFCIINKKNKFLYYKQDPNYQFRLIGFYEQVIYIINIYYVIFVETVVCGFREVNGDEIENTAKEIK